jgi:hypothetical protein
MSVWFSASAVVPQLTAEWRLSGALQSWLTTSVQLVFVAGALLSSLLTLSDRLPAQRLLAVSALAAAAFNTAIPLLDGGPDVALGFRFLTGFALAGYPPGMKLMASWCKEDRSLGIGLAVPHLLNAAPGSMPTWRMVVLLTSAQATIRRKSDSRKPRSYPNPPDQCSRCSPARRRHCNSSSRTGRHPCLREGRRSDNGRYSRLVPRNRPSYPGKTHARPVDSPKRQSPG